MAHKEDLQRWRDYATQNQISDGYANPPIDRLFRKLNIEKPPMLFWSFPLVILVLGITFAALWGGAMYLGVWRNDPKMTAQTIGLAIFSAGVGFGLFMAFALRRRRVRLGLSSWENFKASHPS